MTNKTCGLKAVITGLSHAFETTDLLIWTELQSVKIYALGFAGVLCFAGLFLGLSILALIYGENQQEFKTTVTNQLIFTDIWVVCILTLGSCLRMAWRLAVLAYGFSLNMIFKFFRGFFFSTLRLIFLLWWENNPVLTKWSAANLQLESLDSLRHSGLPYNQGSETRTWSGTSS